MTLTKKKKPSDEAAPLPLSAHSFWSGLSGRAVGQAFILAAPPERLKPLVESEGTGRGWLLSWWVRAGHALHDFISLLILDLNESSR